MFLDCVSIQVESGNGGNGMVAWRREKYVPYGGPDGGDGGKGGDVYLQANNSLQTLIDFQQKSRFKADDGVKGASKNCHGAKAKDLIINVPVGTVVVDEEDGRIIADLSEDGEQFMVALGGRGGRGNARFNSSRQQAPHFAEPGEPSVKRRLRLELKTIADVGLIGLPNAGKSTYISVVSAAKPKIANYPFTTLIPNLGVVKTKDGENSFVVADIPGLIEGASEGVGLGHDFLRHVERTRLLLHLVDATAIDGGDPWTNYQTVQAELHLYSESLANKPHAVVLTKGDALDETETEALMEQFKAKVAAPVFAISSVARQGLEPLQLYVESRLAELPKPLPQAANEADPKASANDDSAYEIAEIDPGVFVVQGGKIERWLLQTDTQNPSSLRRFWQVLKALGVTKRLKRMGANAGDTVHIKGMAFEYYPDDVVGYDLEQPPTKEELARQAEEAAFLEEVMATASPDDWDS